MPRRCATGHGTSYTPVNFLRRRGCIAALQQKLDMVVFVVLRYAQDEAQSQLCARLCADIRALHARAVIYVADNCSPYPPWKCKSLRASGVRVLDVPSLSSAEAGAWRQVARRLRFSGSVVMLQDSCRLLWPFRCDPSSDSKMWTPLYSFRQDVKEPGVEYVIGRVRAPLVAPFLALYDQRAFAPCFGGMAVAREGACREMYLSGASCVLDVPGALRWERQAVERLLGIASRALFRPVQRHDDLFPRRSVLTAPFAATRTPEPSLFGLIHHAPHAFDTSFRLPSSLNESRAVYLEALVRKRAQACERIGEPLEKCLTRYAPAVAAHPDTRWYDTATLQRAILDHLSPPEVVKQWHGR